MIQSFFVLCVIKYFVFERRYYEKIYFWGRIYRKYLLIFKSTQLYQFLSSRAQILHGIVVWGAKVFMFFEIFRKDYRFGEIGEKLIFVVAILDFVGHLGFSNWPHMIFIIITIWRSYMPSFMLVSQSERTVFPISNSESITTHNIIFITFTVVASLQHYESIFFYLFRLFVYICLWVCVCLRVCVYMWVLICVW